MSQQILCQNIFGSPIEATFPIHGKRMAESQFLETLTEIQNYILEKKDALFLAYPLTLTNQCHLYALEFVSKQHVIVNTTGLNYGFANCIVSYCNDYSINLAMILNQGLSDPKLLEKVAIRVHQEKGLPKPKAEILKLLKNPDGELIRAARLALNKRLEDKLHDGTLVSQHPLKEELMALARENPQLETSKGKSLFTFPKFAGVAILADVVARENIPLLFRVRVVTSDGVGYFHYCTNATLPEKASVIVFEMIATNASLKFPQVMEMAKRCHHFAYRNKSDSRHSASSTCQFCTKKEVDISSFQHQFQVIFADFRKALLVQAMMYMQTHQCSFLTFFQDPNFPKLSELYHETERHMKDSENFSVCFAYADKANRALTSKMLLNASYEDHFAERELI